MKKQFLVLFIFLFSFTAIGQTQLSLTKAIELSQRNSPDYQANINRYKASYWRNNNYRSSLLPQIKLYATLPSYSNSTRRITNDLGQDVFVNQNQSLIDANLAIAQNVPFTGGALSINSQLERIDIFGADPSTGYSVTPFSIRYQQQSLFYNSFKWDKKIEPLLYEESKRDFIESMEKISLKTCRLYFNLLTSQMQLKIAKNNYSNKDTLYQIAKGRFSMGKIAENELLQMELSLLNSENAITSNIINLKKASQDLARFLDLETENVELAIPESLSLFEVSTDKALVEAQENRKSVVEFRRKRLEAEKNLARVKGDNRLQLDLSANFGVSRQGEVFNELMQDFNQQQNVTLRLGIPIFDWGVSKSKRKLAEANLDLLNTNLEQDKLAFEQEIYLHTLNWANQRNFLATAKKAQEIAIKRYDITKKRYVLGKITITDLNIAQQEMDGSVVQYLRSLEKFWVDYYVLRRLTLYDFLNDQKIQVSDIPYE